jgi:hypothetical protein
MSFKLAVSMKNFMGHEVEWGAASCGGAKVLFLPEASRIALRSTAHCREPHTAEGAQAARKLP